MSNSTPKTDTKDNTKADSRENLSLKQWQKIETAKTQIKNGQYKIYAEVKEHFTQWLSK
jgi:anti-sigma28 factor (negative regulator of flagellin synthesis)